MSAELREPALMWLSDAVAHGTTSRGVGWKWTDFLDKFKPNDELTLRGMDDETIGLLRGGIREHQHRKKTVFRTRVIVQGELTIRRLA
jgi:hypothetical protein